jgi:hypothetical protein
MRGGETDLQSCALQRRAADLGGCFSAADGGRRTAEGAARQGRVLLGGGEKCGGARRPGQEVKDDRKGAGLCGRSPDREIRVFPYL